MSERTLVLVKPDAVRRGLAGEVIRRFERKGLAVVAMDLRQIDGETADRHYAEHVGKDFYPALRDFIVSGPLVALVLEGDQAIAVVRGLVGATDGREAAAGHDPWRLLAVEPREPRARLGLRGFGGSRDRSLLPKPLGFPPGGSL